MKFFLTLLLCPAFAVFAQQPALPFSVASHERTADLPTYVSPHLPNLYNDNPKQKVGWGIDYPIGNVIIGSEVWVMFNSGNQYGTHVKVARFRGVDFEHTVRQEDGSIDVEKDVSTHFLGGMWYDNGTGMLYAPIHCEYKRDITPPAGWSRKKTRLAVSADKGVSWKLLGDILTDVLPADDDWLKFSGSYFQAGSADFDLFVDAAGGYFYIYTSNSYAPKNGKMNNYLWFNEAARCAISDKMAPGKWRKFCNGTWTEPGLGGRSSKVSMDAYGIYGRIIYSTYLKKYLRIGPGLGVTDRRFTDMGFADASIYLSTCTDLSKQVWSPRIKVFNNPGNDKLGITVTDGNARDPFICDSTLRIYNYWLYNIPSQAIDVAFSAGSTPTAGFPRYGSYAYEPLPESGDPVVGRRTKIVGAAHPDVVYAGGAWTAGSDPKYYRGRIEECGLPGSSVQFSFTGADVYWRAIADSDGGKADVYIDGALDETVDCYFPEALPFQFAYMKTGLDAKKTHTIRIVVRADKNSLSHGTVIRHMAFEHAAESFAASAGFSSVMGKNNWRYQQGTGKKFAAMNFHYADTLRPGDGKPGKVKCVYPNYWGDNETAVVGGNYQSSGSLDAVRTFIAPHAGKIRIEGAAAVEKDSAAACTIAIMNGGDAVLTGTPTYARPVSHDLVVAVKNGGAVHFVVQKSGVRGAGKILWDPSVTFVK